MKNFIIRFIVLLLFGFVIFSCRKVYNSKMFGLEDDSIGNNKYDTIVDVALLPQEIINQRLSIDGGWELKQILEYKNSKWSYVEIGDCMLDNTYIFKSVDKDSVGLITYVDNTLCKDVSNPGNSSLLPNRSFIDFNYVIRGNSIIYDSLGINKGSLSLLQLSSSYIMLYRSFDFDNGAGVTQKKEFVDIYLPVKVINEMKPPVLNK